MEICIVISVVFSLLSAGELPLPCRCRHSGIPPAAPITSCPTSGSYYELPYQWQVSTDKGQTWTDVPGANSAACTLTQAYLSLEELRYGEDLRIIHDIQAENFSIPPLTIEPLVENAVEHEVSDLPDGGSVTLTSMAMQASSTAAGIRSRRTTE